MCVFGWQRVEVLLLRMSSLEVFESGKREMILAPVV